MVAALEGCWNNIVNYASKPDAIIRSVFPNFFSTIFISAWTVFETLAHDLWVGALNAHPAGLAELKGRRPDAIQKQKKKENKDAKRQNPLADTTAQNDASQVIESKAVRLEILQKHNYNMSGVMGDILSEMFSFQKLDGIKTAYFRAFSNEHEIWEIMLDKDIRSVCAIRNNLVHKAGFVDADFKKQTDGITRFTDWKIDKPMPLDGALVDEIISPFFEASEKLILLVDGWIESH